MEHRHIKHDFSNLTLADLTERHGLKAVPRVALGDLTEDELTDRILLSQTTGIPLVISGFNLRKEWDAKVFSLDWLSKTYGAYGTHDDLQMYE